MEIFISHFSALEYWRRHRKLPEKSADRRYMAKLPMRSPTIGPSAFKDLSLPTHILVGKPGARIVSKMVSSHVFSGELPIGCFMNVGGRLLVSSPEFCFLQMASQLTLIEIIELGYELCGTYSLPFPGEQNVPERGYHDRKPLTSVNKLQGFIAVIPDAKWRHKAERALRYVLDGSASPMETKLAIFLTLPYKLGGYGFVFPELNKHVTLPKPARRYFNKNYYVCDLFWGDGKVAVEYDSDQFHTGSERIANDSERRNALSSIGVRVISVTRPQLYSAAGLEMIARTLASYRNRRFHFERHSFMAAHRKLRKYLLGKS
ncbi:MAG: hypothetical protein FWF71_00840 [Actinomycetia bacterium]|nr:hypothetical protein [Actinomycetes bacterium]